MKETPVAARPSWVQIAVVVLLMIASFLIGSLYTKVQYLESLGGAPAGVAKAKYKSFDDAMAAFAKEVKIDGKKLVACMNSGEKKAIVDAEAAEAAAVDVTGTPGFFINGRLLGGAFPFESFKELIDKELAKTATNNVADYSKGLQDANKSGAFNPVPKVLAVGTSSSKGPENAPITIVEFSDFQCPFCSRAHPTVKQVMSEYKDKVRLVYKHLPLVSLHPRAQKTAEAAECAKDQGKFWEFHDILFEKQADWSSL